MSEHCGYIVKITELRKHTNADRLQIATIFGNSVIVSLDTHVGDMGVYFPTDLQLSEEFCKVNDLVRRKDEHGNQAGGYLDPNKRNIRTMKLRGEVSDGLYLPITCLAEFTKVSDLSVGDTIDVVNGHEICRKYIPHVNTVRHTGATPAKKAKANFAPTFYEHVDTAQLAYNLDAFKAGDIVQLTLKIHGTSGRTGYLPLIHYKQSLFDKIFHRIGKEYKKYGYVSGTRRVVLDATHTGGYYDDNSFREEMAKKFEGKLHKGEVCYYEIAGFQGPNGAPIMASVKNSKISDKAFTKQYGEETIFSYGCEQNGHYDYLLDEFGNVDLAPCCDVYVYRMTMVNEDGALSLIRHSTFRTSDDDVTVLSRFGMRPEFALQVPTQVEKCASAGIVQYFFKKNGTSWDIYIVNERNEVKIFHNFYGSRSKLVNAINRFYTQNTESDVANSNLNFNLPQYFVLSEDEISIHPFTIMNAGSS